jgi:hypothetical protein
VRDDERFAEPGVDDETVIEHPALGSVRLIERLRPAN